MKATSAINGPYDDVVLPRGSQHTDWEIELGVVIGEKAKYVRVDDALKYVAGYCVVNDVSSVIIKLNLAANGQRVNPATLLVLLGLGLSPLIEIPEPQNLAMTMDVNGKRMQAGNTNDMIFTVREIIAHLSSLMTLHPGDVIATGTPPGVGSVKSQKLSFCVKATRWSVASKDSVDRSRRWSVNRFDQLTFKRVCVIKGELFA